MSKRTWKSLGGTLAALAMSTVLLLVTNAAGEMQDWSTDTSHDFNQGTLDGVDTWSEPGMVRLNHRWSFDTQVNDDAE